MYRKSTILMDQEEDLSENKKEEIQKIKPFAEEVKYEESESSSGKASDSIEESSATEEDKSGDASESEETPAGENKISQSAYLNMVLAHALITDDEDNFKIHTKKLLESIDKDPQSDENKQIKKLGPKVYLNKKFDQIKMTNFERIDESFKILLSEGLKTSIQIKN